jgi:hypothetical protein
MTGHGERRDRLRLAPTTIQAAKVFVQHYHRHMPPPQGALFAVAVEKGGTIVGVAIVGRPVAPALQDGRTVEVLRLATDGTHNACSFLYGRCRRAAAALGYERVKTYTRQDESGASLRAAGFEQEALLPARSYAKSNVKRVRFDKSEPAPRVRWGALTGVPSPVIEEAA